MDKTDIHVGMIAGNICPKCRANLIRYGINEKTIYSAERMLSYVRSETIGKPMLFDEDAAFIVMRFSQNDESAHAYLYGIMCAKGRVKAANKRQPSSLELTFIRRFDERSAPGKPQVFRGSARDLLQTW